MPEEVTQPRLLNETERLALAFMVAASVLRRHEDGELDEHGTPRARDVPVGAVALDLETGIAFTGFPQDRELGDPAAHAEVQAMRRAKQAKADAKNLLITTTFEPCPGCLTTMANEGVPFVEFATERTAVENLGLIKVHGQGAKDIVAEGRPQGLPPYPELIHITDPVWQAAGALPWHSFARDPVTEKVAYQPHAGTRRLLAFHTTFARESAHPRTRGAALARVGQHIAQLVNHH